MSSVEKVVAILATENNVSKMRWALLFSHTTPVYKLARDFWVQVGHRHDSVAFANISFNQGECWHRYGANPLRDLATKHQVMIPGVTD